MKRIDPDKRLPLEAGAVMREIVSDARALSASAKRVSAAGRKGEGIIVLFTGKSGTGKTMACHLIAGELGVELYRIDLSSVVSKYIGETEKNLRRIFDAAEESGAVLFFDEADALFGKRSDVKDRHDRYGNIDISFLLQLLEEYRGLVIIATNENVTVDEAIERRFRYIVHFPFPP